MFLEQWKALSGRIHGLVQTGQRLQQSLGFGSHGQLYAEIQTQCLMVLSDLERFRRSFEQSLPPTAVQAIGSCSAIHKQLADPMMVSMTPDGRHQTIWAALLSLAAFETEMTFILSDVQIAIRARAERAFAHLQRLIVVDPVTRERWQQARDRETRCEQQGAVHLLWHGLLAFKVNAAGERTDLVIPTRALDGPDVQRYADGLVLTEWKVADSQAQAKRKFIEARSQAKRYSQGVLAGIELTTVRYLVVVSPQQIEEPPNLQEGAVVYRHISIATDPETPSRASRRGGKRASIDS